MVFGSKLCKSGSSLKVARCVVLDRVKSSLRRSPKLKESIEDPFR
jgi:hypothetical protein